MCEINSSLILRGVWLKKGGCSVHILNINDDKAPLENIVTYFHLYPSIIAIM